MNQSHLATGCPVPRIAMIVVIATSCTPFKEDPPLVSETSPTEAGRDGIDAGLSCDLSKPFGVPTLVPGFLDFLQTVTSPNGLRLSPDYLTGYFCAGARDGVGPCQLYTSSRADLASPFEQITSLDAPWRSSLSGGGYLPTVRGDGLMLVFANASHLHYAMRTDASTAFTYMGLLPGVNGPDPVTDVSAFFREDGVVVYFDSDRASLGLSHIYRARWTGMDAEFEAPTMLAELNMGTIESTPVVTPDDRTIYFSSPGPDGDASGLSERIWTATRASSDEPFSTPREVPELDFQDVGAFPSFVSRDGCTLYFSTYSAGDLDHQGTRLQYFVVKPTP